MVLVEAEEKDLCALFLVQPEEVGLVFLIAHEAGPEVHPGHPPRSA